MPVIHRLRPMSTIKMIAKSTTRDIEFLSNFVDIFVEEVGTVSIDSLLNVCLSPSFGLLVAVDTQLNHAQLAWRQCED